MTSLVFKIIIAAILVGVWKFCKNRSNNPDVKDDGDDGLYRVGSYAASVLAIFLAIWSVLGTSCVWVAQGHFMTLQRVYFGSSLQPGQIVGLDGQLGPQSRILLAGFHFEPFITLNHETEQHEVFTVPPGQCALLSAKDGLPVGSSAFAEPWSDEVRYKMANDATFFLTEGQGRRGPQTSVLTPGSYTLNPFLWAEPELIPATRIEQGTVGVIKSSVEADVDFGAFKRQLDVESSGLKILTPDRLGKDAAAALLVPVGKIGVWEEPLPNGQYYINTDAYRVTMVPTVTQVYEYKGGYTRKDVTVSFSDRGEIIEKVTETEVQETPAAADRAIFTKPEGWDVPQELRVLAQVSPEMAPFVVASLGLTEVNATQVIEDRVVTPITRSVVRNVLGGAQIPFEQQRAVLDSEGKSVIDPATGTPKIEMVHEFRAVKVMDLLENRPSLEAAIEEEAKPEALKEGVTIQEVRLAESAIPAEMLTARKREQLAQQLEKAWIQEEKAQLQRQLVENAKAQAEQQGELVKAEIASKAAKQRAEARTTEAEGEKAYLLAIAEGQKAQSEVLGQEVTARLQMFQIGLKAAEGIIEKNPDLLGTALANAHKFVPSVVVSGGGSDLSGAAAVIGQMMGSEKPAAPSVTPAVVRVVE